MSLLNFQREYYRRNHSSKTEKNLDERYDHYRSSRNSEPIYRSRISILPRNESSMKPLNSQKQNNSINNYDREFSNRKRIFREKENDFKQPPFKRLIPYQDENESWRSGRLPKQIDHTDFMKRGVRDFHNKETTVLSETMKDFSFKNEQFLVDHKNQNLSSYPDVTQDRKLKRCRGGEYNFYNKEGNELFLHPRNDDSLKNEEFSIEHNENQKHNSFDVSMDVQMYHCERDSDLRVMVTFPAITKPLNRFTNMEGLKDNIFDATVVSSDENKVPTSLSVTDVIIGGCTPMDYPKNYPFDHTNNNSKTFNYGHRDLLLLDNGGRNDAIERIEMYALKENYSVQLKALADLVTTKPFEDGRESSDLEAVFDVESVQIPWRLMPLEPVKRVPFFAHDLRGCSNFDPRVKRLL